jgi:hypothetical protein
MYISFIVKELHALNRVYNCVRTRCQPLQKHRALAVLSDIKTATGTQSTDAWNVVNINMKTSNEVSLSRDAATRLKPVTAGRLSLSEISQTSRGKVPFLKKKKKT